jgi:putative flavoprotein involved in K+ transport
MSVADLIAMLEQYAASTQAPVVTDTLVRRVEQSGAEYVVTTNRGVWRAATVVVATGYCDQAAVPEMSRNLRKSVVQLVPAAYRNPERLAEGAVLIIGASSTGVQLADEIQRSGRQVTLAVGRHTRLPRRYRGRDILWWLDRLGVLTEDASSVHDIDHSRRQPSLQLAGRLDHSSLDLSVLHDRGVRLTGRLESIDGPRVTFRDDLIATTAAADLKMAAILARIDEFIGTAGMTAPPAGPFQPTWPLARDAAAALDLEAERIATVIWATGYRRQYSWLRVPVCTADGEIAHDGGITPARGLYVLGLNFQRQRNSSFIDGVGADAVAIARHIAASLGRTRVA